MRTLHWLRIQKWVQVEMWELLSKQERSVIKNDTAHYTPEFKQFNDKVIAETDLRYNNPQFPANTPDTFKYTY